MQLKKTKIGLIKMSVYNISKYTYKQLNVKKINRFIAL